MKKSAVLASAAKVGKPPSQRLDSYNRVPGIQTIRASDLISTLRVFAACTSAHGMARLNHPVKSCQIGWALVITAAFVALTVNMSSLVTKYRDEPITTKINARGNKYIPPDITICNRMMFAISRIFNSTLAANASAPDQTEFRHDIAPEFRPVFDSVQKIRQVLGLSARRYLMLNYGAYETDSNLLQIEDESAYNLPNLVIRDTWGDRFLSQFRADPSQGLLSCTYGTRACDINDFQLRSLPAFPSCATFSVQRFSQRRPNVTKNSLNGLRIGMFVDSHHSSPAVTDALLKLPGDWFNMQKPGGAVVFVHQPGTYPTQENQIEAPVNQETVVSIRYLEYTSKSTRKYRCMSATDESNAQVQYMVQKDQSPQPETFQAQLADCLVTLTQEVLLERCGFIDPNLPLTVSMFSQVRRGNLSHLLSGIGLARRDPASLIDYVYQTFLGSNASELPAIIDTLLDNEICLRRALVAARNDSRMHQRCINRCQAKIYETSVMPIAWPEGPEIGDFLGPTLQRWLHSNSYYPNNGSIVDEAFLQQSNWNLYQSYVLRSSSRELRNANSSLFGRIANKNFLAIRFDVADAQGRDIKTDESFAYELYDLLSDMGGILGLYIGISVLTVCEVAELLLQLAVMLNMIAHRRRMGNRTEQSDNNAERIRRVSIMSATAAAAMAKGSRRQSEIEGRLGPSVSVGAAQIWQQLPVRVTRV
uniref:PBPe domain-containing protein n=1 Tax=Macrostomum lignano TaxID=282301 RepID=A0A1I8IC31_9PLAT